MNRCGPVLDSRSGEIKGSARLLPSFHASINHPISVWLRCHFLVPQSSLCVSGLVCFCSVMDLNRILFVSKGKQLVQCVYAGVGVCTNVRRAGVQGCHRTKLINRPFARAETGPNKMYGGKRRIERDLRSKRGRNSEQNERESLFGLNDCGTFADHFGQFENP